MDHKRSFMPKIEGIFLPPSLGLLELKHQGPKPLNENPTAEIGRGTHSRQSQYSTRHPQQSILQEVYEAAPSANGPTASTQQNRTRHHTTAIGHGSPQLTHSSKQWDAAAYSQESHNHNSKHNNSQHTQ
jgi:hypothetical protein